MRARFSGLDSRKKTLDYMIQPCILPFNYLELVMVPYPFTLFSYSCSPR